jgi:signal transduction histidine kinase
LRPLATRLAEALAAANRDVARQWLERLDALVDAERGAIFPGPQLLDHVPDLLQALARSLEQPAGSFEARTSTAATAGALGRLRHGQGASLHQLLREFELLEEILHEWLAGQVERLGPASPAEWLAASARMDETLMTWVRLSADAFAHRYAESLQRERNEVQDLHRTVDHELRTPMGTIANVAGLLEMDADRRSDAGVIQRSLSQMTELLGMLRRDVWRPEAEAAVAVQECDLESLVEDVLSRLADSAASRKVALRMSGRFGRLVVDAGALTDDDEVVLEIRDNGIGIPQESVERIFERGFRAHADADERLGVEGDGLGLYLTKGCVESLGGRMEVESKPGGGSAFRMILPRRPAHEQARR